MTRGHSRALTLALVALLVMSLGYANYELCLVSLARWLNVGEQPHQTDYVLILNGDPNVRPFYGSALVNSGLAETVLLVPMKPSSSPWASSHEQSRRVLRHRGVPEERIVELDGVCTNTFEEAAALGRFLRSSAPAQTTVAVVTSHFHTRRARWIFRKVLGADAARITFLAAPVDGFSEFNWWQVEEGFLFYLTEYLKFAFYVIRYGDSWWLGALVLLIAGGMRVGRWAVNWAGARQRIAHA